MASFFRTRCMSGYFSTDRWSLLGCSVWPVACIEHQRRMPCQSSPSPSWFYSLLAIIYTVTPIRCESAMNARAGVETPAIAIVITVCLECYAECGSQKLRQKYLATHVPLAYIFCWMVYWKYFFRFVRITSTQNLQNRDLHIISQHAVTRSSANAKRTARPLQKY